MQIIRSKADPTYKAPFTNMFDCVRQSFVANGLKAPFQGLGATLLRNIPANSIYLGSFEVMKLEAAHRRDCKVADLPGWIVMGAAGLGGIMYWCAACPSPLACSALVTTWRRHLPLLCHNSCTYPNRVQLCCVYAFTYCMQHKSCEVAVSDPDAKQQHG